MFLESWEKNEVHEILSFYARGLPVYAFGSRVHGRLLKKTSDLDLCVKGVAAASPRTMRKLRGAFEIADLPMRVDVVDWYALSNDFQSVIARDLELIWDGARIVGTSGTVSKAVQV